MVVGVVDHFRIVQAVLGHDRRVPVAGPTFVHDLRLTLRREVVRLIADDGQDVVLPVSQRSVLQQEQQHVALWLVREGSFLLAVFFLLFLVAGFLLEHLGRIDERVHVALRWQATGLHVLEVVFTEKCGVRERLHVGSTLDVHRVHVDQVFQRQAGVDELLDLLVAETIDVLADPRGVIRHLIEHLPIRLAEPGVVLEEIAVPVDVSDDQLLIDQQVRVQQVRVARVSVDDHFVDALQAVHVRLDQLVVLGPEPPVRIAHGEATVSGEHAQLFEIEHLEDRLEEIEAIAASDLFGLDLNLPKLGRQRAKC